MWIDWRTIVPKMRYTYGNPMMLKRLRHFLLPHEGNDHHPHIFRPKTVAATLGIIIASEMLFLVLAFASPQYLNFLASILPNVLVDLTNEARAESSVGALAINPVLVQAAEAKAHDMATKGYFAHISPEGVTPWYWLQQEGYEYTI